ncbi:hypothetical protein [Bosea sp. CRIB-10]|uniref:hypothetical protein n=1 Tax=Bosea sp. CRIB-10 TaxID=378404 RepID=UPI0015874B24|nr:hypothetical protein [Bosea sp. CRIB-10]
MTIDDISPAAPVGIPCVLSLCRAARRNCGKTRNRNPQLLPNAIGETATSAAPA